MDPVTSWLLELIGHQWVTITVLILWGLYHSGLVGKLTGAEIAARAQLSQDQQNLIVDLQASMTALSDRLTKDRLEFRQALADNHIECDRKLATLRMECDADVARLNDQISILVNGESRWRHLTGNLAAYVAALQAILRKSNIEVPRFTGWERFIEEGGDPLLMEKDGD